MAVAGKILEAVDYVLKRADRGEPLLVCERGAEFLPESRVFLYTGPVDWTKGFRWAIFCRRHFSLMYKDILERIEETMRPVFANSGYVCYTSDPSVDALQSGHLRLWGLRKFYRLVLYNRLGLKFFL